ncbi:MAG TPA: peptidyl-prolyl cis-trans isomerase [Anaerolineales bacterium]|nr:peptidyl-prolyl cis-trans isomerase [Anaerolineales bacterium]
MNLSIRMRFSLFPILLIVLFLSACGLQLVPSATPTPTVTPTPTATPVPLALSVNGEGITVAEFNAELARYQQAQSALGNTVSLETATQAVLDNYIDTLLLEQAAIAGGYKVDDAALQSRIDSLTGQLGGTDALSAWETAHGYIDADFRSDLRRQMAAVQMRDQIIASVPSTAEQVHVKQILLYNSDAAQQALGYLKAGWTFDDLAARYDPVTKGELGWFPRGYLPEAAIETAAFALQPGQYSDVIQTQAGYHILYLEAIDPARPLSPDALLTLQEHALQDWLAQQRNKSTILLAP